MFLLSKILTKLKSFFCLLKIKIGTITDIGYSFGFFENTVMWASVEKALEYFVA